MFAGQIQLQLPTPPLPASPAASPKRTEPASQPYGGKVSLSTPDGDQGPPGANLHFSQTRGKFRQVPTRRGPARAGHRAKEAGVLRTRTPLD